MPTAQNMLSGVGLYLLAIGVLYGRTLVYPKALENVKADKRDKDKKLFNLDIKRRNRKLLQRPKQNRHKHDRKIDR